MHNKLQAKSELCVQLKISHSRTMLRVQLLIQLQNALLRAKISLVYIIMYSVEIEYSYSSF